MVRSKFDQDLIDLNNNLIEMGYHIEEAIDLSVKALINQDRVLAQQVFDSDKITNEMARKIESEALKILLRQQPVASDLRKISTALKIVTDMERIGDQAQDIGGIVFEHLCEEEYQTEFIKIPKMAERAKFMVHSCIDSFIWMDTQLAENVVQTDAEVDELFIQVKDEMIELLQKNPKYADQAIYLMMVAKYFEKIADHAENIAEWVIFCKTGQRKNVRIL